ncbi:MAG: peptidyl-prolyl cis-trans isomerase [Elusimicrobia bacterium]|nr:peptidyl-prolyl cis-trans isomerase [Elusimicrobiota bacterium]
MLTTWTVALLLAVPGPRAHAATGAPSKGAPDTAPSQARDPEIAKVNGVAILRSQFQDKLLHDYGQAVMESMVNRLLLLQEARSRKIAPDKAEIDGRMDAFVKNRFETQEAFADFLQRSGATAGMVREEIMQETTIEKLITQAKGLSVTDKEVQTAFEKNKARLGSPPSVHLRMMKVKDKAVADEVVAKLKKGAEFASLVEENSLLESKKLKPTGDYGFVPQGQLPPEIDKAAFAMKVGETKTLQTKLGHFVLQILEARAAQAADFNQLKSRLRDALMNEKFQAALPDFVRGLREKADIQFLDQGPSGRQ